MRWAEPAWLFLLPVALVPWLVARRSPRLAWPSLGMIPRRPARRAALGRWISPLLGSLALAAIVLALARPQAVAGQIRIAGRGLAIALVLDRSSSMTAVDGERTRLETALSTLDRFVRGRPDDLVALVAFANYPDRLCPPTLDHETLRVALAGIEPAGSIEDGTNIGDAIAVACDALGPSTSLRKVIILVSDGANDPAVPEPLEPLEAAGLARSLGITVHTIAVGRPGGIVRDVEPTTGLAVPALSRGPDLELLRAMAERGGGRSYHAAEAGELPAIFEELDRLERGPVSGYVRTRYREIFGPLAAAAAGLIAIERLLSATGRARLP